MRVRCLASVLCVLSLAQAVSAAPIVGVSANTIPQGTFMLDTWFSWRAYQREWDEGLDAGDPGWRDLREGESRTAGSLVPRLSYGVTDWLTVRAAVPLEDRSSDLPGDPTEDSNTGLGDIVIDPKIEIHRAREGYPRVALLAGVQLPTGGTGGTLPLSDGSTDFVAGAAVTHETGSITAHAYLTYWVNGQSASGVDLKDVWVGCVTLEAPIDDGWSLLWEAKSYVGEKPSEYYRIYACPGIAWSGERLTVGVSSLIPAAAKGTNGGVGRWDVYWAPYVQVYYRFF